MRIGLFGGTFDPIHWGHLRSAEEVREAFDLDRVFFIPASRFRPWRLQGEAFPTLSTRFVISPKTNARVPRFILLSVSMHLPRSAPGRILKGSSPFVISL